MRTKLMLGLSGLLLTAFLPLQALADTETEPLSKLDIESLQQEHRARFLNFYREFLQLPNVSSASEDIEKLTIWVENAFENRRFDVQRLTTEGAPMLLAVKNRKQAKGTLLVYLQADGQPVNPASWNQADPFQPVVKKADTMGNWGEVDWSALLNSTQEATSDWRIFARSASDSKGPMAQFIYAMGVLEQQSYQPDFNIKVIVDFEEELGSPNIRQAIQQHRDKLSADALLVFDGPPHFSNQPTLNFGARGIMTLRLQVFGPKRAQHSGHMGNYVPNPAFKLANLLASMKNLQGQVLIEGFYQGVQLTEEQRAKLADIPDNLTHLRQQVGFAKPEAVGQNLQEAMQYPSLNIRGLSAAWTGAQVRTIIPASAVAEIDIRLVPSSSPEQLLASVTKHIRSQGFHIVTEPPSDAERQEHAHIVSLSHEISYGAFATDMDSKVGRFLTSALTRQFERAPLRVATIGGSVPISPMVQELNIPAVLVPTVNMDNNQHSPDENIRVGHLIDGLGTVLAVFTEPMSKHF